MNSKTEIKNKLSEEIKKPANRRKGQALMEFAVFGSIILIILGALISYGLKYNYQQDAQMKAYRRALKIASDQSRASVSYVIMADKHVPDPADTFAVGSPTAIVTSASVTRTNQLDAQASDAEGLPTSVMAVQTSQANGDLAWAPPIVLKNAGFRIETNVPEGAMDKYKFIFPNTTAMSTSGTWVTTSDKNVAKTGTTINEIRIEDACIGQMIDHDSCAAQAMYLVDVNACITQCRRTTNNDTDTSVTCNCACICNEQTHAPNQADGNYNSANGGAWYAANYVRNGADYTFPALENLFAFAGLGPKTMGTQSSNSVAQIERASSVHKIETTTNIMTDESASWSDRTPKQIVTNENLNVNTGFENVHANPLDFAVPVTNTINTEVSGEVRRTLTTGK